MRSGAVLRARRPGRARRTRATPGPRRADRRRRSRRGARRLRAARCRWRRSPTPPGRGPASRIPISPPRLIKSIERAVGYVRSGAAQAIVTNPISKKTLYEAGFAHPGHTEFLGELAKSWGGAAQPVMMIWSPLLAVVPVTIHIPLADVPAGLTRAPHRFDGPHRRPRHAEAGSASSDRASLSPASIRTRGKAARSAARRSRPSRPPSPNSRPKGSTSSGPCPPIRCFIPRRARATTSR